MIVLQAVGDQLADGLFIENPSRGIVGIIDRHRASLLPGRIMPAKFLHFLDNGIDIQLQRCRSMAPHGLWESIARKTSSGPESRLRLFRNESPGFPTPCGMNRWPPGRLRAVLRLMFHKRAEKTALQRLAPRWFVDVLDQQIEKFPCLDGGKFINDAIFPGILNPPGKHGGFFFQSAHGMRQRSGRDHSTTVRDVVLSVQPVVAERFQQRCPTPNPRTRA